MHLCKKSRSHDRFAVNSFNIHFLFTQFTILRQKIESFTWLPLAESSLTYLHNSVQRLIELSIAFLHMLVEVLSVLTLQGKMQSKFGPLLLK